MVNSLDISTLVTQIPEAQKVQNVQDIHPETQQILAQELVLKKQKQEQKQIAKPEQSASKSDVDKDGGNSLNQNYEHSGKKREKRTDDFETSGGHLIDLDV